MRLYQVVRLYVEPRLCKHQKNGKLRKLFSDIELIHCRGFVGISGI